MRETTGLDFDAYVKDEEWGREQDTAQREQETELKNHQTDSQNITSFGGNIPTETDKDKQKPQLKYKGNKYFDKVPDPLFDDDEVQDSKSDIL
jgi:hypothetical protein